MRSHRLLTISFALVSVVAAACGYADQSHLIRKFKATYGVTPGQYLGHCNNVQSTAAKRGY